MSGFTHEDIDREVKEIQERRRKLNESNNEADAARLSYDQNIYCAAENLSQFDESIPAGDQELTDNNRLNSFTAPAYLREELEQEGTNDDPMEPFRKPRIIDRESDYQRRRMDAVLSPSRADPFEDGGKTPRKDAHNDSRTYSDVMMEVSLKNKQTEVLKDLGNKTKAVPEKAEPSQELSKKSRKRSNWDVKPAEKLAEINNLQTPGPEIRTWEATPSKSDEAATPNVKIDGVRVEDIYKEASMYAGTPQFMVGSLDDTPKTFAKIETPSRSSRWNLDPNKYREIKKEENERIMVATPLVSTARGVSARLEGMAPTPKGAMGNTPGRTGSLTPEQMLKMQWEFEIDQRNKPWTDEDLNALFPFEGYKIIPPPQGYKPIRTPFRRVTATPTPAVKGASNAFVMSSTGEQVSRFEKLQPPGDLPELKSDDMLYFEKLMKEVDEDTLPPEESKEIKIMKLLLKIKNGTPPMRKSSLRQITDKAREFGAGPLFNQILPLLMSPTLEDQERHLLVKVIDRILYKLDDLVRPYVHKILVVIEPLLIDEDYYARVEGREIISNLAKAAGLATMISSMRPDIDDTDEYVRNTTARAFAVVASALGIPALLPFLRAVCKSKKSWQARHTGIKIIQQISILMGCAILPHLRALVEIISHGLEDEQLKVRTITALGLAGLAEAATPYGIESFDCVLKPLWKGIRQHRGKALAAFLKAIGFLIPLMDAEYAFHYTKEVVIILVREFPSPDEEMKRIVLKVVKQCCSTDGVEAPYIKSEILPEYFRHYWNVRMANDKKNYKQLVETTADMTNKVGSSYMLSKLVDGLKDDNENYRIMVTETIDSILVSHGATDIDTKLEEQLIDGVLYAFQEQALDEISVLDGFGTIVNTLGIRTKPYIPQICGTILWRLSNKAPKVRQLAADLVSRITPVMKLCDEEKLIGHLGIVLYEYLGEEYPETLGSILGGLKAVVNVSGMHKMTPPIKDLLPRLTPILKNRHEKVQENCIDLVGRIADRGAEHVSAREWMRICFELLELLKAHKKAIRRAAVNTFGYIAKAIGPQDVMATLLNNLKVQERQNRVCTTIAIAIVAESCSPFTILPALLNEYRVPEVNVQNGVLKSLAFLFEYIGEMCKDYIYAVMPLLEDALIDRDIVHRQIASASIKHLGVGVYGFANEDALLHLLNFIFPNIYETSPHMINAVMEAIEGIKLSLGPARILQYVLQGLFHPARRIRDAFWKVYNMIYIASQDALVAFYPTFENEGNNHYVRDELFYVL